VQQRLAVAADDNSRHCRQSLQYGRRRSKMVATAGIVRPGQLQQTSLCTAKLANTNTCPY